MKNMLLIGAVLAAAKVLAAGAGFGAGEWIAGAKSVSLEKCGAPYVGRTFVLREAPRTAEMRLAVCGWHELEVNGRRVGDVVLSPTTCQPDRRIGEIVYDLSDHLVAGTNRIAVLLGNGWWSQLTGDVWGFNHAPWHQKGGWEFVRVCGHHPPMVSAGLVVDGETVLRTDGSWRAWDSPIVFNQFRNGEHYDARLAGVVTNERPVSVSYAPAGVVTREDAPPCRAFELGGPVRTIAAKVGGTIYDFGHNVAGWCESVLSGPAGARVMFDYDESLDAEGTGLKGHVRSLGRGYEPPVGHDEYVCAGRGEERWHPRFTYHGFRYVKVTAEKGVALHSIRARFVHSDFASAGSIATSDPLFARLQDAVRRSYLSNFVGIPTDCPHREKNGWTGDAQLACETGLWNFDAADGYRHFIQMAIDAQRPNGALSCILPACPIFGYGWGSGPAWDAVIFTLPREIFRFTGDDALARKAYEAMKRYRAFIATKEQADGLYAYGLGDWCPPKDCKVVSVNLTDSACGWSFDRDLAFWARRFGEPEEAAKAEARAAAIRAAFNRKFYKGEGVYGEGELTALACPLYFKGLCVDGAEHAVVARLVASVRAKKHVCDFGILGAKWVPRVLAEHGYVDDAWQIFVQRSQPGYQWWFDRGEDTLWETFDAGASHNHIMFGDVSAWAYEYIAGIRILEPGFAKIAFRPHAPKGVERFEARHRTPRGEIRAGWRRGPDGKPEFFCDAPQGIEVVGSRN